MHDDDDRYLTQEALARYSSLSTRTLRKLAADPVHPLPVHRINGRVLYKRSEFDQWLREHESGETTRETTHQAARRIALAIRGR